MQCNSASCGVELAGVDFLITSCGDARHAFCNECVSLYDALSVALAVIEMLRSLIASFNVTMDVVSACLRPARVGICEVHDMRFATRKRRRAVLCAFLSRTQQDCSLGVTPSAEMNAFAFAFAFDPVRPDMMFCFCRYDPSQILSICGRALQFWDGQQNLRTQLEQERRAEVDRKNVKLKASMAEMHAKQVSFSTHRALIFLSIKKKLRHCETPNQVSAVNILQARIKAAERELEAERETTAGLQARCAFSPRLHAYSRLAAICRSL
eukprot:3930336-Rhodomonas_salina.3